MAGRCAAAEYEMAAVCRALQETLWRRRANWFIVPPDLWELDLGKSVLWVFVAALGGLLFADWIFGLAGQVVGYSCNLSLVSKRNVVCHGDHHLLSSDYEAAREIRDE